MYLKWAGHFKKLMALKSFLANELYLLLRCKTKTTYRPSCLYYLLIIVHKNSTFSFGSSGLPKQSEEGQISPYKYLYKHFWNSDYIVMGDKS